MILSPVEFWKFQLFETMVWVTSTFLLQLIVPTVASLSFSICYVEDVIEPRLACSLEDQGISYRLMCNVFRLSQALCRVLGST